ncbi:hypothetical protein [Peribacillus sp. Bi134]|uniref:hypothetical protein n=1 Tax=Peribacillus sp. Bi134 TaxID=2884272 RepID=UPI001DACF510|nr:hypothetical protein [Peribacillus sp. Bi134]CAH0283143.1 hypothetical protein SRABI134_04090 [Peribacillus sp. Bi134]
MKIEELQQLTSNIIFIPKGVNFLKFIFKGDIICLQKDFFKENLWYMHCINTGTEEEVFIDELLTNQKFCYARQIKKEYIKYGHSDPLDEIEYKDEFEILKREAEYEQKVNFNIPMTWDRTKGTFEQFRKGEIEGKSGYTDEAMERMNKEKEEFLAKL